ncbi:putative bifunctional diguanylate cyclase/phosphodiesterase [Stutzerimonas tarimensis]|uniref:Bifunctional diguanylate cyclase/phosphodiesterase n=1 Tax=Stutzerimonas tarimensis TaxID=1507735 RepID=A0ABV7T4Q0_9GAMM
MSMPAHFDRVEFGYRAAVDAAAIFSETDARGVITYVNDQFCEVSGYSADELLGQDHRILNSGHHPSAFFAEMWRTITSGRIWKGEVCNQAKDGSLYWVESTIVPMQDAGGEIYRYVSVRFNITEEHNMLERLRRQVGHDELTGLPNRTLLAEHFERIVSMPCPANVQLAVCMLDLDDFKDVNDRHGHAVGDLLLTAVATRLASIIRNENLVARIGGDEFVLILHDIERLPQLRNSLKRVLARVAETYLIEGIALKVTASLGVTLFPSDNVSADTLLRHADQALYQAKQQGGNRFQLFDVSQALETRASHQTLARMTEALHNDELVLHYQPKVNLRSGKILGFEALLRWQHPERGTIPPLEFLPVVERADLIVEIGDWVIERALDQLSRWRTHGKDWSVSVNIAARHLKQDGFAAAVAEKLAAHPELHPEQLDLELIESVAIDNIQHANRNLEACREAGVRISLDDFGTGYSSLSYLKRLPVQTIKIDQSFIRGILDDPSDQAVTMAIISLCRAFDRDVIAEGVETRAQAALLLSLGCELAQGYGIARPMPAEQVLDWAESFDPARIGESV